jgi:hypothetical protein
MRRLWMTTVLTGLLLGLCGAYAQSNGQYDLSWWTIDAGGVTFGADAAGRLLIGGTFGQPDASEYLTDAFERFQLRGGFWYTVPTEAGCTPADGDIDRNGCVDDADLLDGAVRLRCDRAESSPIRTAMAYGGRRGLVRGAVRLR